jgi:hypothetical protein
MFSIVICSINAQYLEQITQNISATIGMPFELLILNNSKEKKGICEVYNEMASLAKFPYICFFHEDILIETNNWGEILARSFDQDEQIGLIGVAGGKYKSRMYSGWYSGNPGLDCMNITHRIDGKDIKMIQPSGDPEMHEVVCLDGVVLVTRAAIWQQIRFDASFLKGFHFYDIDFSLRAARICKVMVTMKMDIIHITSGGDYGNRWVRQAIDFHQQRQFLMPYSRNLILDRGLDTQIARQWLDWLKLQKISFSNKMQWIQNQQLFLRPQLVYAILKFLIYTPLRLNKVHHLVKGLVYRFKERPGTNKSI